MSLQWEIVVSWLSCSSTLNKKTKILYLQQDNVPLFQTMEAQNSNPKNSKDQVPTPPANLNRLWKKASPWIRIIEVYHMDAQADWERLRPGWHFLCCVLRAVPGLLLLCSSTLALLLGPISRGCTTAVGGGLSVRLEYVSSKWMSESRVSQQNIPMLIDVFRESNFFAQKRGDSSQLITKLQVFQYQIPLQQPQKLLTFAHVNLQQWSFIACTVTFWKDFSIPQQGWDHGDRALINLHLVSSGRN